VQGFRLPLHRAKRPLCRALTLALPPVQGCFCPAQGFGYPLHRGKIALCRS